MVENEKTIVPVWTLATRDVSVPAVMGDGAMTPDRLDELRTVLATLAGRSDRHARSTSTA